MIAPIIKDKCIYAPKSFFKCIMKKKYKSLDLSMPEAAQTNHGGKFFYEFKNQYQKEAWDLIHKPENRLIFLIGGAGSGKSWLATTACCKALLEKRTRKIHLCRPYVPAVGEQYGYLKGDLNEKLAPVIQPILDIVDDLCANTDRKKIEEALMYEGIGWCRGRTFNNWCLGDEFQNCNYDAIKLITTRIGRGCKMIITADPFQSDTKSSGLLEFIEKVKNVEGVVIYNLPPEAQVREDIVRRILAVV